jgi:hypothetical protein
MYTETDGDRDAHDDSDLCVAILLANEVQLKKDLAYALARAALAEAQRDDLRALVQGENGLNARALKIMQLKMEVGRLENENDGQWLSEDHEVDLSRYVRTFRDAPFVDATEQP